MKKEFTYVLYDYGREIMRGKAKDIASKLDIASCSINHYARCNSLVKKRYRIGFEGDEYSDIYVKYYAKPKKKLPPEPSRFERDIDFLVRHLKTYGNTVIPNNDYVDEYLYELKIRGFDCEISVYKNYGGENIVLAGNAFSKREKEDDVIVRLKK